MIGCCGCTHVHCPTCGGRGVLPVVPVWRPYWPVIPYVAPRPIVPFAIPGFQPSRGARIDMALARG